MPCNGTNTQSAVSARHLYRSTNGIQLFPLLDAETFTANVVGDNSWDQRVISTLDFEPIGPRLADLVVHAELQNKTGSFAYRVVLQRMMRNGIWKPTATVTGYELLAEQTAEDYVVGSPFSSRDKFGLRLRVLLQWHAKTGGAVGDRGDLSIVVAANFLHC